MRPHLWCMCVTWSQLIISTLEMHLMWQFAWEHLTRLCCARCASCRLFRKEIKEWKTESVLSWLSQYWLILVYSVPNAISNKNKSLCSRWCWWKQGWGISSEDVCLSYFSLISEWIRLLNQRHKHYSEGNCFSRRRLWNNICMTKGSTMDFSPPDGPIGP